MFERPVARQSWVDGQDNIRLRPQLSNVVARGGESWPSLASALSQDMLDFDMEVVHPGKWTYRKAKEQGRGSKEEATLPRELVSCRPMCKYCCGH